MDPDPCSFIDYIAFAANSELPPEVEVVPLSELAFERHYPQREITIQPQLFSEASKLTIAVDSDLLDDFAYESLLQSILNISENVNLNDLQEPCLFGRPVLMRWHDDQQQYVRGNCDVQEATA